jgi:hypothetical protein
MSNRRFIIIRVEPDFIAQLMDGWKVHSQLGLPSFREGTDTLGNRVEFPQDMEVSDVNYDWYSRCIQFRMYHSTFAEVPNGESFPVFSTRHVYVNVVDIKSGIGESSDPIIVERPCTTTT